MLARAQTVWITPFAAGAGSCWKVRSRLSSGCNQGGAVKAPEQLASSSRFFQAPWADTIALLFQQVATVPLYYYTALEIHPDISSRAVKALHGFPEGCVPHPQVEMQLHYHQDLRKPARDLQEFCEWLTPSTSDSFPSSEQTPSRFLLFKPQSFSHFSSCICFSPTGSCHPSSRLNCGSRRTLNTLTAPFRLSFNFIFTWTLTAVCLRPQGPLTSLTDGGLTQCWN